MELAAIGEFLTTAGLHNKIDNRLCPARIILDKGSLAICIDDGDFCIENLNLEYAVLLTRVTMADPDSLDKLVQALSQCRERSPIVLVKDN